MSLKSFKPFLLIALAVVVTSCSTGRTRKSAEDQNDDMKVSQDSMTIVTPDINVEEASLRGKDFQNVEGLMPIFFDYDSAALKQPQLELLKKNAEYLKQRASVEVLVSGYCDERGTTEYNLALGQKRAKEVREYYIRLGVPGQSLATISYGKESPFCGESAESCWSKNRRAETRIRLRVSGNGSAPDKSAQ